MITFIDTQFRVKVFYIPFQDSSWRFETQQLSWWKVFAHHFVSRLEDNINVTKLFRFTRRGFSSFSSEALGSKTNSYTLLIYCYVCPLVEWRNHGHWDWLGLWYLRVEEKMSTGRWLKAWKNETTWKAGGWENNIKIDLKEAGYEFFGWANLPQHTYWRLALVNTIMKLWKNARNFLTSWETVDIDIFHFPSDLFHLYNFSFCDARVS